MFLRGAFYFRQTAAALGCMLVRAACQGKSHLTSLSSPTLEIEKFCLFFRDNRTIQRERQARIPHICTLQHKNPFLKKTNGSWTLHAGPSYCHILIFACTVGDVCFLTASPLRRRDVAPLQGVCKHTSYRYSTLFY